MKPVHEHDCETCIYMGTITRKKRKFDLYYCGYRPGRSTVIARYGKLGDYLSGLSHSYNGPLKTAALLAIKKGFLHKEYWERDTAWFNELPPEKKKELKGW